MKFLKIRPIAFSYKIMTTTKNRLIENITYELNLYVRANLLEIIRHKINSKYMQRAIDDQRTNY